MRASILVIGLLLTFLHTSGQESKMSYNSETIKNYFADKRASLHLHLNKTTFLTGEEVWFTAYSFNREAGLSTTSQHNINVALIDSNGKEISKHLLSINDGTGQGTFILKETLAQGTYFIKAFTASMNNFLEDESYIQAIHVLNLNLNDKPEKRTDLYDIQILPEGGHIVDAVENTCGIKILNVNGSGVATYNITLVDDRNNVVLKNIKTNELGMGKFVFTPKHKRRYTISMTQNDSILKKQLPNVERKGIALKASQNYNSGVLQIKLTTNKATLPLLLQKKLTAMVHKDGLSTSYDVQFESGYNAIVFQIPNSKLYPGVNTITIFDETGNAILERLVFNAKSIPKITSILNQTSVKNDTFGYELEHRILSRSTKSKVSISVLPARSLANTSKGNIYASAYLAPFVKGHIENPSYYFNPNNHRRNYALDLLLLNQGWSKYSWNHMYNFKDPKEYYDDGPGIRIDGYLRTLDTTKMANQILLYSKENEAMEITALKEDGTFRIDSLIIDAGSRFEFSAQDASGSPIGANFFYTISPKEKDRKNKFAIPLHDPFVKNEFNYSMPFESGGEKLDEVVVKTKKLKYSSYFKQYNGVKITTADKSRGNLRNYLAKFDYRQYYNEYLREYVLGKVVTVHIIGELAVIPPRIIVDGISYNPSVIVDRLHMEDIDEIYAYKPDLLKTHTFIIFTNGQWSQTKRTSKVFAVDDKGIFPKKEYYRPAYSYESESFQHFGTLQWIPSIYSNDNGLINFSVYNPTQLDFNVFIEGITADGKPFSSIKRVDFKSDN